MKSVGVFVGFLLASLLSVQVVAKPDVEKEITGRIVQSQTELQGLQKKMMQESAVYAANLDREQKEIASLREKAAVIRRQKDEQLLSLEQIKNRVDQWSSQSNYQKSLMANYLDSVGLMDVRPDTENIKSDALDKISADIDQRLHPSWKETNLVIPSGEVIKAKLLTLGAVKFALGSENQTAGIAVDVNKQEVKISYEYNSTQQDKFSELSSTGVGEVSFDPTLGKAFELRSQDGGLISHIQKGGAWAVPIVIFGVVSLIISLLKAFEFIRLPILDKSLADNLMQTSSTESQSGQSQFELKNKIANASPPQKQLLEIAKSTPVSQQRDDLMVAYLMTHKHKVEKFMGIVSISAAIAPLLGLLGTVSGMISTFKMMTIFGTGDASTVSSGISIALITTELGLIVAIPSLVASALLSRKVKSYTHDLENFAIKISKINIK